MTTKALREQLTACQVTAFKAVDNAFVPPAVRTAIADILELLGALVDRVETLEKSHEVIAREFRKF